MTHEAAGNGEGNLSSLLYQRIEAGHADFIVRYTSDNYNVRVSQEFDVKWSHGLRGRPLMSEREQMNMRRIKRTRVSCFALSFSLSLSVSL